MQRFAGNGAGGDLLARYDKREPSKLARALRMIKIPSMAAILVLLGMAATQAQEEAAPPAASAIEAEASAAARLTADQLDQLCGPIALYPDPLLAQILI